MSHYAKLDNNNIVTDVITAEQDFINSIDGKWLQTSYNTKRGKHLLGGEPLRMNYAGIGFFYNSRLDAFISPKPYESWLLDENICDWVSPVQKPDDGKFYVWNEDSLNWVEIQSEEEE